MNTHYDKIYNKNHQLCIPMDKQNDEEIKTLEKMQVHNIPDYGI